MLMWAAAAAAAVVLTFGGLNEYRQQQKAERARRDAVIALRITAEKLNHVRAKVLKVSSAEIKEN